MKRKLQLVAALSHQPKLLILDEPFRGLDPLTGFCLKHLIQRFSQQAGAALIATHDLLAAQQLCSKIVVIDQGRTILSGDTDEITEDGDLEQQFLSATGLNSKIKQKESRIDRIVKSLRE